MQGGVLLKEPVKLASDILSPVSIPECETIATLAEGKVVLVVGSDLGRLPIAIASVAQRVHVMDSHGGDNPMGNTVSEFVANLKRYRALDRILMHVGLIDKALLVIDRAVFHIVVVIGDKGLQMVESMGEWFASGSFILLIHATKPDHVRIVNTYCAKRRMVGKKLGERIYQIEPGTKEKQSETR